MTGHNDAERDANIVPYRVIADHIRAAVFLISDGVYPGAKGRAAIPRIVIRRAARFGREDRLRPALPDRMPFLAENIKHVITWKKSASAHDAVNSTNQGDDGREQAFSATCEKPYGRVRQHSNA